MQSATADKYVGCGPNSKLNQETRPLTEAYRIHAHNFLIYVPVVVATGGTPATRPDHPPCASTRQTCQNFNVDVATTINNQIREELNASYIYQSMVRKPVAYLIPPPHGPSFYRFYGCLGRVAKI